LLQFKGGHFSEALQQNNWMLENTNVESNILTQWDESRTVDDAK